MRIDKRWDWRKRKRGEAWQAIHSILRVYFWKLAGGFDLWISTALFAISVCRSAPCARGCETGVALHLFPRLNRQPLEEPYYTKLVWRHLANEQPKGEYAGR